MHQPCTIQIGGPEPVLSKITVRDITVEEAKACKEMMVLGGSFVRPITVWVRFAARLILLIAQMILVALL